MARLLVFARRWLRFNLPLRRMLLAAAIVLAVRAPFLDAAAAWWAAAALSYYLLITVGFSVGMHRYFCHRSFATSRGWQAVMLGALVVGLAGVPYTWVRAHLNHHKHADRPEDPYQVKSKGWRSVYLAYDPDLSPKYVLRWLQDPMQRTANDHYFAWVALWLASLWAIGGSTAVTFLWAIPVAVIHPLRQFLFHYSVHTWGYRNFATADDSRNNWWIALLTGGEGWHNNHHREPRAWNYRQRWWEFDPGALFIACIRRAEVADSAADAATAATGRHRGA